MLYFTMLSFSQMANSAKGDALGNLTVEEKDLSTPWSHCRRRNSGSTGYPRPLRRCAMIHKACAGAAHWPRRAKPSFSVPYAMLDGTVTIMAASCAVRYLISRFCEL
jgi:hypothetical protein